MTSAPDWFATLETDTVAQAFEAAGYAVTWDGKRSGERWYEVLNEDGCVFVQIDMGVPLEHLKQDFADHLAGLEWTSPSDYVISGPDSPELEAFMRAVVGGG